MVAHVRYHSDDRETQAKGVLAIYFTVPIPRTGTKNQPGHFREDEEGGCDDEEVARDQDARFASHIRQWVQQSSVCFDWRQGV